MGLFGKKDGLAAADAAQLLERGEAVLLDVREPDEWRAGHAPGAVHVPLDELTQNLDALPRDRRIVAVCRSGARSERATKALRAAGLQVDNLLGGMKAWQAAGLPLEPRDGRVA